MSTVGKIVYKILGDNSDLAKKLDKVGDMAEQAAASVAKIGAAAMGVAATGIGILSKKAIECYSDYEQLTGGVETLFKDSADIVMQYADNAYKAAGMSANAYMETVTSFSASLLQGLDGDTAQAAEIANQAIVDMSDNANKMGTSMDMIQNAYQGFAKQNYTMLDNLKLGYGGTQAEMARLINDSGVLGDSMTVTAQTVNSVSFDKIIEAIHVIQTNMGITGTTAKEASTTIQGSISAMSAAWENFMTGVADPSQDFDRLTSNLIDSVLTVADNLIPRIMAVLPQMATGLEELAGDLLPLIPETLEKMLPDVLAGANNLISALLETLSSIAETAIPIVSENAEEIIDTLLTGMLDSLPAIADSAVDLCSALVEAILENVDIITQGAFDLIIALADGISDNIDEIIPAAISAVVTFTETLLSAENIEKIAQTAISLVFALVDGLLEAILDPEIIPKIVEIVVNIGAGLIGAAAKIIPASVELCEHIADTLVNYDWSSAAETAMTNIGNALDNAQKRVQVSLDNLLSGGKLYGGDVNSVSSTPFIENYRKGTEEIADVIESGQNSLQTAYNNGKDVLNDIFGKDESGESWLKAEDERRKNAEAVLAKYKDTAEKWAKAKASEGGADSGADFGTDEITEKTEELKEASEEEKKSAQELEKALKQSVTDKFRELETEQLEKGYDDSWLLEQERAFVETLDHNSETYKDYNLDLLKEQERANAALLKAQETAADKQKDAVEKSYEDIVKSRDKLADSLKNSADIFSSEEETDKRTGAKKKSRDINLGDFEKKLAAKKKLTSKIADLLEANTPDSLISKLLKQDPEDALHYANELLRSPSKLSDIKAAFKEDEDVSKIFANMVTENSPEFEKLGTEAGTVFGESFIDAFNTNWESAFESVFSDKTISVSALAVGSANASAASESTYVRNDNSPADSGGGAASWRRSAGTAQSGDTYKVVDLNGKYIATVVNTENRRAQTQGGG